MKTKHVSDKAGPPLVTAFQYKYLTASDIAKIIGVTPQTINNWRRDELIPASVDVQDTVRYDLDEVRSALTALTRAKQLARGGLSPEIAAFGKQHDQQRGSEGNQRSQVMATPIDEPVLAALLACLPAYLKAIADALSNLEPPSSGFWTAGMLGND